MIKIFVITPDAKDANSFWRCMGPLSYLGKDPEIQITLYNMNPAGFSWVEFSQYDIIFLHRPCSREHVIAMQIAYNLNKPVWVDFDDYLFQLPGWNPHAEMYHSQDFQLNMAQCIAAADVVSVTTAELYNQYSAINNSVIIVPNAYRNDLFTYREVLPPPRHPVALWRGSNTHDGDLLSVREGFLKLKTPTIFMGNASWLLLSGMDPAKVDLKRASDVIMYFRFIYEQRPKVFVFPLVDCLFNRCKSNIAYIEAIHAGAICVAPNMPEWNRPGILNYEAGNSLSFAETVEQAFAMNEQDHVEFIADAAQSVIHNYGIESINLIRKQIVAELMAGNYKKKNPFDQSLGLTSLGKLKARNAQQKSTNSVGVS